MEILGKCSGNIQANDNSDGLVVEKDQPTDIQTTTTKSDRLIAKDFVLVFSLYNTVPVLSMKQSPSAIKALSGIRFHTITLIIMNHIAAHFFITLMLRIANQIFATTSF